MFEIFGEFDSAEELNKAAEGQKNEGDKEGLIKLAAENGIDEEDALDYFEGVTEQLCTPLMAALGKLQVEAAEIEGMDKMIFTDWLDYIKSQCAEYEGIAIAVRRKNKSLKGCMGALLKWSYQKAVSVDAGILKAAGINNASVKLGIPDMKTARTIINKYYMTKGKK